MSKKDKAILILSASITLLIFLTLFFYGYFRKKSIEANKVYVIAYIYKIDSDVEGVNYRFFYNYSDHTYFDVIGSLDLRMQNSMILLKISSKNPKLWLRTNLDLPKCVIEKPDLNKIWKEFPTCKAN
jgi:hypothetical protein